jgi:phosphate transport system protein
MAAPPTVRLEAMLQHDIDLIRDKLRQMGTMDERALTRAMQAFVKRDRQLAYSVILHDQDVDALETEIDRLCLEFFVRHQPAAGHLRFVYSASKVVTELERVGDYAESIARQVLMVSSMPFDGPTGKFNELANVAIPMLHNAVQAFVDKNSDLARATMAIEPQVDRMRDSLTAELVEARARHQLPLDALAPLIKVARRLERVSDQATNICEQAIYFATGEYFRHLRREGFRVVFVDENNGCLSLIAEAIGNRLGEGRFSFGSAGISAGPVDPQTIWFLAEKGIDISHRPSLSVEQIPQLDYTHVIVALSPEADKVLPQQKPAKALRLEWSVPDPSKTQGNREEVRAEYERVYQTLYHHVSDLINAILGDGQNSLNEKIDVTP